MKVDPAAANSKIITPGNLALHIILIRALIRKGVHPRIDFEKRYVSGFEKVFEAVGVEPARNQKNGFGFFAGRQILQIFEKNLIAFFRILIKG